MNMKRLYSRRSDGGLQTWDLEVKGDSYRVSSGKLDGKQHTNDWTKCVGKNLGRANATTPAEQATAEAAALWDKKYSEGYRESEAALATVTLFEPMLAKNYKDCVDDISFPVYTQPKLDGIRCIARSTGLFTRKGKPHLNLRHVEQDLAAVFKAHPTLVIDGEGYADKLAQDFNQIVHLIKQQKPTAQDRADSAAMIKYHVYDCYFTDHPEYTFACRQQLIQEILEKVRSVQLVDTFRALDQRALDCRYAHYLTSGYEGQMIRTDTPYECKRTKALLKRKEFIDAEFTIADVMEGIGNRAGGAGAILLSNGCKAGIRGNAAYFTKLLQERTAVIGKQATVRYQGVTPDGMLRFPVMVAIRDYE